MCVRSRRGRRRLWNDRLRCRAFYTRGNVTDFKCSGTVTWAQFNDRATSDFVASLVISKYWKRQLLIKNKRIHRLTGFHQLRVYEFNDLTNSEIHSAVKNQVKMMSWLTKTSSSRWPWIRWFVVVKRCVLNFCKCFPVDIQTRKPALLKLKIKKRFFGIGANCQEK